jgi:hypothetical protein
VCVERFYTGEGNMTLCLKNEKRVNVWKDISGQGKHNYQITGTGSGMERVGLSELWKVYMAFTVYLKNSKHKVT